MRAMKTSELLNRLESEILFCYDTSMRCMDVLGNTRSLKDYSAAVQNEYERVFTTIDMMLSIDMIAEPDFEFMASRLKSLAECLMIEIACKYASIK